jgi:tripartite-type tricarboxylate transporter receptor subunit TctC
MFRRTNDPGDRHDFSITRRRLLQSAAIGLVAGRATAAAAQEFPSRPVTIVVPFPPGGQADTLTRLVAAEMSARLGQPVVVDNRSGAGGAVGTASVAQAKPDGHTLIYSSSGTMVVLPATTPKLAYNPDTSLTPVGQMFEIAMMLVARKGLEASTLPEVVALAKASPGKLTIGNTGVGALAHLVSEYLRTTTGTDLLHVPYRGDGPQMTALVNGEVDLGSVSVLAGSGFVRAGEVKPIAILGAEPVSSMPGVPTVASSGYPGFAAGTFGGLHAPAGTPPEIVMKLHGAMAAAVMKPEIRDRILASACLPIGSTPGEYAQRIAAERKLWGGIIERLNLKLE